MAERREGLNTLPHPVRADCDDLVEWADYGAC